MPKKLPYIDINKDTKKIQSRLVVKNTYLKFLGVLGLYTEFRAIPKISRIRLIK